MNGFSGSYDPQDVTFLLTRIALVPTPVAEKERMLQSGERHYSEMIGVEAPPDAAYLELYEAALDRNGRRLAQDVAVLARALAGSHPGGVTLLSLARAGTPIGVLLRRALAHLGVPVAHYAISIIRGRGIDERALDHVRRNHAPSTWVFVDGWTGKGAISAELRASVGAYAERCGEPIPSTLAVVADLAGTADLAASNDDYLIPSSILNAVVSGLVSRTILPKDHRADQAFHRCVSYEALAPYDLSRCFVDQLTPAVFVALGPAGPPTTGAGARERAEVFLHGVMRRWGVTDPNRVKPGIGEATRALLRRVPDRLVLGDPGASDVRHLELLAARSGVEVETDSEMPYRACALIRQMGGGE